MRESWSSIRGQQLRLFRYLHKILITIAHFKRTQESYGESRKTFAIPISDGATLGVTPPVNDRDEWRSNRYNRCPVHCIGAPRHVR